MQTVKTQAVSFNGSRQTEVRVQHLRLFFNWVGPRYWIYTRSIDAFFTLRLCTKIVSSITDLQSCEPGQGSTRCDFVLQRWAKTFSSPSDSCWGALCLLAINVRYHSFISGFSIYFRHRHTCQVFLVHCYPRVRMHDVARWPTGDEGQVYSVLLFGYFARRWRLRQHVRLMFLRSATLSRCCKTLTR